MLFVSMRTFILKLYYMCRITSHYCIIWDTIYDYTTSPNGDIITYSDIANNTDMTSNLNIIADDRSLAVLFTNSSTVYTFEI